MTRTTTKLIIPCLLALTGACTDQSGEEAHPALLDEEITVDHDEVLEDTAQRLAGLLHDSRLRDALRAKLAERVSGDYEVMLASIADLELADGRLVGDVLGGAFALTHVQIAAPGGVDWTDEASPVVTFIPADRAATELAYFDASGARVMRPVDEQPAGPVLVVGRSERIGFGTHVIEETGAPRSTSTPVYLRELVIWNDKEPWYKGDPEIYMKCMGNIRIDLPDVDEEGHAYRFNTFISYLTDAQGVMPCEVRESDGDDADDTLGIAYFYSSKLQLSTSSTCYGAAKDDFLMGVAQVKGTTTVTFSGSTVTVPSGCPYYRF